MVDLAVESSDWMSSSSWELSQSGFRDFDAVRIGSLISSFLTRATIGYQRDFVSVQEICARAEDPGTFPPHDTSIGTCFLPASQIGTDRIHVFYVCGSDHALKCGLYDETARAGWCDGVVVMSRPPTGDSKVDDSAELLKYESSDFQLVPTTTDGSFPALPCSWFAYCTVLRR